MKYHKKVHESIILTEDELENGKPKHKIVMTSKGEVSITNCDKCGYCCSKGGLYGNYIALTDEEVKSEKIKGKEGKFINFKNSEKDSLDCPNLGSQGCSLLKEERPFLCNSFPFLLLGDEIIIDTYCPAVKNYTLAELAEFAKSVAKQYAKRGEAYMWRANQAAHFLNKCIYTGICVDDFVEK